MLQRVLCAASLLLLQAGSALSDTNVCDFGTANLYVRDASQTAFPPGFLSCLGAGNQPIARCATCKCRDKQAAPSGGKTVEWGLCVEGTEACVTPQTPDREYCANTTESGTAFRPGTVSGANTDGGGVISPMPTSGDGVNELATNNIFTKSSGSSGTKNAYIVGGCAVAGVAAVAMFAVSRKNKDKPLGLSTPVEDPAMDRYDNTKTSKANNTHAAPTMSYEDRASERMSGESMISDGMFQPNDSYPMPPPPPGRFVDQHNQQQQKFKHQISSHGAPPSYAAVTSNQHTIRPAPANSGARESSFFGSDTDERYTFEDQSAPEPRGFESMAYGKAQNAKNPPNFDSSFMSVTSNGFDTSFASLDDFKMSHIGPKNNHRSGSIDSLNDSQIGGSRNTSLSVDSDGLTIYDRDTEASEFLRGTNDSVMSSDSSSSSLSFNSDEASPRSSIEF